MDGAHWAGLEDSGIAFPGFVGQGHNNNSSLSAATVCQIYSHTTLMARSERQKSGRKLPIKKTTSLVGKDKRGHLVKLVKGNVMPAKTNTGPSKKTMKRNFRREYGKKKAKAAQDALPAEKEK